MDLPEAGLLANLFERSLQGVEVLGQTNTIVSKKLNDIFSLSGLRRWIALVDILIELAESKTTTPITSTTHIGNNEKESKRLCNVFDWITSHFEREITLQEAADIAQMNANAFSRFFSMRTRKTFSSFVQELRLQKAAKLLVENEMSVTQVCYDCGYNNISNFNRQFLNRYHVSPMGYKKEFMEKV
jgi:transcriptional regulator GlxA family with amidase domain